MVIYHFRNVPKLHSAELYKLRYKSWCILLIQYTIGYLSSIRIVISGRLDFPQQGSKPRSAGWKSLIHSTSLRCHFASLTRNIHECLKVRWSNLCCRFLSYKKTQLSEKNSMLLKQFCKNLSWPPLFATLNKIAAKSRRGNFFADIREHGISEN